MPTSTSLRQWRAPWTTLNTWSESAGCFTTNHCRESLRQLILNPCSLVVQDHKTMQIWGVRICWRSVQPVELDFGKK